MQSILVRHCENKLHLFTFFCAKIHGSKTFRLREYSFGYVIKESWMRAAIFVYFFQCKLIIFYLSIYTCNAVALA